MSKIYIIIINCNFFDQPAGYAYFALPNRKEIFMIAQGDPGVNIYLIHFLVK
jgi:hypothetical protein